MATKRRGTRKVAHKSKKNTKVLMRKLKRTMKKTSQLQKRIAQTQKQQQKQQQQLKQHQSTWPAEVPREPTKPGASLWALEHDLELVEQQRIAVACEWVGHLSDSLANGRASSRARCIAADLSGSSPS